MTPLVVRPRRLAWTCAALALLAVVSFSAISLALSRAEGEMRFGPVDQVLMTGFGVLLAAVALGFTRARVVADADGVRVRNALREVHVPWPAVVAVRFDDGAPWASLELPDEQTVALFAVQAVDGDRTLTAVARLRELLEQSRRAA